MGPYELSGSRKLRTGRIRDRERRVHCQVGGQTARVFAAVCRVDLDGIVAKWANDVYHAAQSGMFGRFPARPPRGIQKATLVRRATDDKDAEPQNAAANNRQPRLSKREHPGRFVKSHPVHCESY